jgi:phosphatidate phosphatase LPIN
LWLEILLKRPDEFKIEELGTIRALFAPVKNGSALPCEPFYSGFGNRETDTKSYKQVGEI